MMMISIEMLHVVLNKVVAKIFDIGFSSKGTIYSVKISVLKYIIEGED